MSNQDYVLYWSAGSPFAWRVMIYLYEKDIPFESHQIQFSKMEHKSESFLKMNPRGKVPVFVDRSVSPNIYLYESLAIIQYLESRHGSLNETKDPRALANSLIRSLETDNYLFPEVRNILGPCWHCNMDDWNLPALKNSLQSLDEEIKRWDVYLHSEKEPVYMNGTEKFSLADAVAGSVFLLLDRFGYPYKEKGLDHLDAYVKLLKKKDSIQKSWPPHWHNSECTINYSLVMEKLSHL